MNLKRIVAATAIAGSLGAGAAGFGSGTAYADDHWVPWVPNVDRVVPNGPAPGQVKNWCPWQSAPGHWIGGPHGIPCT